MTIPAYSEEEVNKHVHRLSLAIGLLNVTNLDLIEQVSEFVIAPQIIALTGMPKNNGMEIAASYAEIARAARAICLHSEVAAVMNNLVAQILQEPT